MLFQNALRNQVTLLHVHAHVHSCAHVQNPRPDRILAANDLSGLPGYACSSIKLPDRSDAQLHLPQGLDRN
jgi:hypothetical protein